MLVHSEFERAYYKNDIEQFNSPVFQWKIHLRWSVRDLAGWRWSRRTPSLVQTCSSTPNTPPELCPCAKRWLPTFDGRSWTLSTSRHVLDHASPIWSRRTWTHENELDHSVSHIDTTTPFLVTPEARGSSIFHERLRIWNKKKQNYN